MFEPEAGLQFPPLSVLVSHKYEPPAGLGIAPVIKTIPLLPQYSWLGCTISFPEIGHKQLSSTVIKSVSLQLPFVQTRQYVPATEKPQTVVFGLEGLEIVAVPILQLPIVQIPVP